MSPSEITVIVPTFNEAENLPRLVSSVLSLPLPQLSMLVVDDNSPDGTGDLADTLAQSYPGRLSVIHREKKLGLGPAYIAGFHQAIASGTAAVTQMDADFSHPPEKLVEMAAALKTCDIVIGSRYIPGGSVDERWPIWRKSLSAFGNFYARTLLTLPIRDVTGGFRLYRANVIEQFPWDQVRSNGYSFQVEIACLAHKMGFTFKEIPIYFADRRWGKSKMSLRIQIEAAIRVWQMMYRYRHINPERRQPPLLDSIKNLDTPSKG